MHHEYRFYSHLLPNTMQIGLYFGSFNPIHVGHLIIANHLAEHTPLEQVWLVVSPHNPHKAKHTLARDRDRLNMVQIAIEGSDNLRASDIEFRLPKPSYTIDTLVYLEEQYPQHQFSIIIGGDNLATLDKWKNFELLLERYTIYVYPRTNSLDSPFAKHPHIHLLPDVPMMDISASFIRNALQTRKSIRFLVPEPVREYIEQAGLYVVSKK